MNPDFTQSLAELQRGVGQLQANLARALEMGRKSSDGKDSSGAVTVALDDGGTARDIEFAPDWRRRLRPDEVGAAVVAADTAAARGRAEAVAEALASLEDGAEHLPPVPWPAPVAPAVHPRPLTDIAEAAWSTLNELDRFTGPPAPVAGSGAEGAVHLTLTQGRITDCAVDLPWLSRQDETTLSHAVREALRTANTAQVAANQPAAEFSQRLNDLLAEVKGTLRDIHKGEFR